MGQHKSLEALKVPSIRADFQLLVNLFHRASAHEKDWEQEDGNTAQDVFPAGDWRQIGDPKTACHSTNPA